MFHWTADMVRFMEDAAAQSGYYRVLAGTMAPWLKETDHVCDAGCGIGALSRELAKQVKLVTAADISALALAPLVRKPVENIRLLQGNLAKLPPEEPYDVMVFSFFGSTREILSIARQQCRGTVFAFMKNKARHRFSVNAAWPGRPQFERTRELLDQLGICYEAREMEVENGQPLKSLEEARKFILSYSRDEDQRVITEEYLKSRLVETGRADFPYYMPQTRNLGWLRFDAGDIPADWEERIQ